MTDTDHYSHAIEQVRYEGQLLWQIFGAFLFAHTIFLAFLLQTGFDFPDQAFRPSVFYPAVLGAVLCLPWYASYSRSSDYYIFRMAQARALEPLKWELLCGTAERFSAGESVEIADKRYQIRWLARALRTRRSVPSLILSFLAAYVALVVWRGPW